jgi:hypothetical protein
MNTKIFKSVFILTTVLVAIAIFSSCSKEDDRDNYVGSFRTNI